VVVVVGNPFDYHFLELTHQVKRVPLFVSFYQVKKKIATKVTKLFQPYEIKISKKEE
jgi:hypothetical protein